VGTLRTVWLLASVTVIGLVAAFVRVAVQDVLWPLTRVSGAQLSADNSADETSASEKVCEIPAAVAVRTAV
jgi:hypothetical protein